MVCCSKKAKEVFVPVAKAVFDGFKRQLDPEEYVSYETGTGWRIQHRKSSAYVAYSPLGVQMSNGVCNDLTRVLNSYPFLSFEFASYLTAKLERGMPIDVLNG